MKPRLQSRDKREDRSIGTAVQPDATTLLYWIRSREYYTGLGGPRKVQDGGQRGQ